MTTLDTFLNSIGQFFLHGESDALIQLLDTPTALYVNDQVIMMTDPTIAAFIVTQFHKSLQTGGLHSICFEVLDQTPMRGDGLRVTVAWTVMNKGGDVIASATAVNICEPCPDTVWKVKMIEFDNSASPGQGKFLSGLPLL